MRDTLAGRSVGDIVAADWRTAAIFDRLGIDFCCGGGRTVADACRAAGVDPAAVEQALAALPAGAAVEDPREWPIDRLIDHIVETHHAYVRAALPRIGDYLAKLTRVHGARHPELHDIAIAWGELSAGLQQHMQKEEHVLFPYVRELAAAGPGLPGPFSTVEHPIRVMEREHEEAGGQLRAIRRLSRDYAPPADACTTYRVCFEELAAFERDLHRHVHLENHVLFPKAVALEAQGF